jgi:hypothetical protein
MPAAAASGIAACSPVRGMNVVDVVVLPPTTGAVVVVVQPGPEPLPLPLPDPGHVWAPAPEAPTTVRQTRNPKQSATLVARRPIVRT